MSGSVKRRVTSRAAGRLGRGVLIAVAFTVFGLFGNSACARVQKLTPDALFAAGNEDFDKGRFHEAIVRYRLAIEADPRRADIRLKLADTYLRFGDGSAALKQTVMAADLMPDDMAVQVKAGGLLLYAGMFEDAKARADKALAIDVRNVDALMLKGNALAGLKNLDGALTEFQESLAFNPSRDQAYASIGAIQFSRGNMKEAEATFRKAIAAAPDSAPARAALASFLWASRRLKEAEAALKEAVALNPENLFANRALGLFYLETRRTVEAEPYLRKVAEVAKTDAAQFALADYYLSILHLDDARNVLAQLADKPENFQAVTLRLASIDVSRNDWPGATDKVQKMLAAAPNYAPGRVFELRLLWLTGKPDEALAAANKLLKTEIDSSAIAEAHFTIGAIEASRDRTELALQAFEEALRIQPQSIRTALAMAEIHLRMGSPAKVEALVSHVLTIDPRHPAARAMRVRAWMLRNDMLRADSELARLEHDFPNAPPVLNLVAARNLSRGQVEAGRAAYAKVLTIDRNNLEAFEGLVNLELRQKQRADAINRVEAALKNFPPSAELWLVAARTYFETGNMVRAEELLKQTIERRPAWLAAYSLLGELYVGQHRLPDAQKQFEEFLNHNPQSIAARTMLGLLLETQKDVDGAEKQYLKTLEINPGAAVAANNLAWIYLSQNRKIEEALQLGLVAARGLPADPRINDTLGWAYCRKGLFQLAVTQLELSVHQDPTDPGAHYHLGMAYIGTGDRVRAKASLEHALAVQPEFPEVDDTKRALAGLTRK